MPCKSFPKFVELAAQLLELVALGLDDVLRRLGHEPLVGELALVAETSALEGKPTKLKSGELTVLITDSRRFGASLLVATGSKRHLDQLRKLAKAVAEASFGIDCPGRGQVLAGISGLQHLDGIESLLAGGV